MLERKDLPLYTCTVLKLAILACILYGFGCAMLTAQPAEGSLQYKAVFEQTNGTKGRDSETKVVFWDQKASAVRFYVAQNKEQKSSAVPFSELTVTMSCSFCSSGTVQKTLLSFTAKDRQAVATFVIKPDRRLATPEGEIVFDISESGVTRENLIVGAAVSHGSSAIAKAEIVTVNVRKSEVIAVK